MATLDRAGYVSLSTAILQMRVTTNGLAQTALDHHDSELAGLLIDATEKLRLAWQHCYEAETA